jgi:glucosamine kinase
MSFLIVDGGGTKTHAWLVDAASGSVIQDVVVGPSNINSIGEAGLRDALREMLQQLSDPAPQKAIFGLAGAGRPSEAAKAEAIVHSLLPSTRLEIITDARLAYAGAFSKGKHGILLIAGTGTIALYQNPSGLEYFRAGGWGPLLGDEGGGAWMGREALRHCLFEWEHGELSPFHEALLEFIGAETSDEILTRIYHHGFGPAKWAALAPMVFRFAKEDPGIMRILQRAAVRLVALAERLIEDLPQRSSTFPLVIIGGLTEQQSLLRPLIQDEIDVRNLPLTLAKPDGGPLEGGLALLKNIR